MNSVRCVETVAIEMKFFDPITAVCDEKFANWSRIWTVEINYVPPFVSFTGNQIVVAIYAKLISVWPEVVINDVQNYTEA